MDERGSGEVKLSNIEPDDFAILLKFAYTGKVEITQENVQNLCVAADYLRVDFVKQECAKFMAQHLDMDNICYVIIFSINNSLSELKACSIDYLTKHLDEILQTRHFSQLSPDFLVEFFSDDDLILYKNNIIMKQTQRELLILTAVLKYLSSQSKENEADMDKLMSTVRLLQINEELIYKCLDGYEVFGNHKIIQKFMKLKTAGNKFQDELFQDDSMTSNIGADALNVPDAWFKSRKCTFPRFYSDSHKRYAAGGQIARCPNPPEHLYEDQKLEIHRMELWIRLWDGRKVIGGLSIFYRNPLSNDDDVEYTIGGSEGSVESHQFELEPNEFIIKVVIGSGYLIDRLGFTTNLGRNYGPFGGPGGSEKQEKAPFEMKSYLYDINCSRTVTQGSDAIYNLMLRWIVYEDAENISV